MQERRKPLGMKNYGHIAHLPGSRLGPGDHKCEAGQARIATVKARDRHDYVADTSPFEQHWRFAQWVYANQARFLTVLRDGERLVGEWLMQAHGTRYQLAHEPFVAFDLMASNERARYDELMARVKNGEFVTPTVIHRGAPQSIESAMEALDTYGFHGASDPVEGAVWRIERNELVNPGKDGERRWIVDFLVKYVRHDKQDGIYLPEISGKKSVWNWR